jgi:hypothetical protein
MSSQTTTRAANVGSILQITRPYCTADYAKDLLLGAFTGLRTWLISIVVINLGLIAWGLL